MKNEITFFAKTNFRNQQRAFGIKTDDRRRHMYIIGKTGMGKTNLLENLAVQDIRNGHGVCYIDPHGDTAEKLLKSIPANRINDVIYFNPADQNFPIAFNVMESIDPEYRHLVASGLVGVFKKIWADSWGPRLEYILRNSIMALLEYPGSTLLGVTRILVDKKYRERVVERVTDPVIRQFWVDEFPKWSDKVLQEVVSPIQNKVGQFLSNSLIRNIVGQTKSSFDVRQIMDSQKILIMNLSKGRIGEDASALLGAMMITKIQLAAMGRVDIPEESRNDFYLYVDEFQNFATESFANILSEARKYRLNLILANQYIEQILETVRNAIFGNAGTIISFRVGATDAEFLEKEFAPVFMQNDIVNLPKYNIYLKLMIDGIAGDAFSATTLPPVYLEDTQQNEETIIRTSREHYTTSREEIEQKIAMWSGMALPQPRTQQVSEPVYATQQPVQEPRGFAQYPQHDSQQSVDQMQTPPQEYPPQQAPVAQPNPVQPRPMFQDEVIEDYAPIAPPEPPKPMFDAQCETCGDTISVPFKPDGKRPTFCKDCLKDYQRALAKAKLKEERIKAQQSQAPASQTSTTPEMQTQKFQQPQQLNGQQHPLQNKPQKPQYSHDRVVQHKHYASNERPMTLSQLSHVAPKKFKQQRQRPNVDLNEVRSLIEKNKKQG